MARRRAPNFRIPMRWRGPESNWRHHDFQSCALPTELPRRNSGRWYPPLQDRLELLGPVQLDQVAGVLDELEACTGDELRQAVGPVDGDPRVLGAPDDEDRQVEPGVERLDLVGVALI